MHDHELRTRLRCGLYGPCACVDGERHKADVTSPAVYLKAVVGYVVERGDIERPVEPAGYV